MRELCLREDKALSALPLEKRRDIWEILSTPVSVLVRGYILSRRGAVGSLALSSRRHEVCIDHSSKKQPLKFLTK
jgi:hypothetical protein